MAFKGKFFVFREVRAPPPAHESTNGPPVEENRPAFLSRPVHAVPFVLFLFFCQHPESTMFEIFRRWLRKSEVMAECKQAAGCLNRDENDSVFQNSVCDCMERHGYKHDGIGYRTDEKSYSS
ncbi:MAG: hypothetical protein WBH99_13150 [Azovibrio sp.]